MQNNKYFDENLYFYTIILIYMKAQVIFNWSNLYKSMHSLINMGDNIYEGLI